MRIFLERILLGILIRHSSITVPDITLRHNSHQQILEALKLLRGTKITTTMLIVKLSQLNHVVEREEIQAIVKDAFSNNVPSEATEGAIMARSLTEDIYKDDCKGILLGTVRQAEKLIVDGKEKEGICLLKTIKFSQKDTISTRQLMMLALSETAGFNTGVRSLDDITGGLISGNIMSITGDTGSMKTTFSLWLILKILEANPTFKAIYFEKEMPATDLARKLINRITGMNTKKLMSEILLGNSRHLQKELNDQITDKQDKLLGRLKIIPNTDFHTVYDMHEYIDSYGCDIWCLDYTTQMSVGRADFNIAVLELVNALKDITSSTGSFGILINQMKKLNPMRTDKRPTEDDAEWSGAIKQISPYHLGIFFPSKHYPNLDKIKMNGISIEKLWFYAQILKNRHGGGGQVLPFIADPTRNNFEEPVGANLDNMKSWWYGYDNAQRL